VRRYMTGQKGCSEDSQCFPFGPDHKCTINPKCAVDETCITRNRYSATLKGTYPECSEHPPPPPLPPLQPPPTPPVPPPTPPPVRPAGLLIATSQGAIRLRRRGFKMHWLTMTWRDFGSERHRVPFDSRDEVLATSEGAI